MEVLYSKIELAQNGNEPAILELIQQFSPLLKKYSHLLQTEDALNDLTVDFIELIKRINLESLRSHSDGVLVTYIRNTMHSKYIFYIRKEKIEKQVLHFESIDNCAQQIINPSISFTQLDEDLIFLIPDGLLTENENYVIRMLYKYGYSAAEIARDYKISRQAVNQMKLRAIEKLRYCFHLNME